MPDESAAALHGGASDGGAALGEVYGFLATVFRCPLTASSLGAIRSPEFVAALADAGVVLDDAFAASPDMTLLDQLAIDYTQLFHGPNGHISPYESVRTAGDGGELNGPAARSVRDCFETSGFAFNPNCGEFPDHIAVELEFMAEMIRREAAAEQCGDATARRCRTLRREFFDSHIGTWGREFGEAVSRQAKTCFYGELGRLLVDTLELDGAALQTPADKGLGKGDSAAS